MSNTTWQETALKIREHRDETLSKIDPAISNLPETLSTRVIDVPRTLLTTEEIAITEHPLELLIASLANGELTSTNCVYELLPTRALSRAQELDAAFSKGGPVGPLHGLPISVKEHIGIKGLSNTAGFVGWENRKNSDDSNILKILLEAGAVLYVRTTEPQGLMALETCSNITGITTNPHNTSLTPGGSSGGEAALIALGGSVLGIGSDIGGSIRSPAANCGIYGLKPTPGRLPVIGLAACMIGCEMITGTIGPMSRTLEGLDLFMKVVLSSKPWTKDLSLHQMPWGPTDLSSIQELPKRKLTIGVMLDDGVVKPSPPVLRALEEVVEKLKLIPDIEVVSWKPYKHDYGIEILLYAPDGGEGFFDALKTSGEPCDPLLAWILRDQPGIETLDHYGVRHWTMEREIFRYEYLQEWNNTAPEMDIILCPVGPLPAPPLGTSRYWGYTSIWNLLDYPGVVFPVTKVNQELDKKDDTYVPRNEMDKFYHDNYDVNQQKDAPVALQIVAKKMEDDKTIQSLKVITKLIGLPFVDWHSSSHSAMAENVSQSHDGGLHETPIPGTVHLVDLEGTMRTRHDKDKKDIVLIPPPSSHPDDPLNWSPKRKAIATACVCLYTLAVGFPSAAIYSVLVPISMNTGISVSTLNDGTGYMFLFFGWGCAFWQPLALQYGKRPVYLFSLLATLGFTMWGPYAKTNGQWIASKILQGFFGAPIESLCEISMTDIHFTHNRGSYMTLYAFFLAGSNYVAPVLAGFIADGQGWRWVLYWCAIFLGLVFVILFFFMEETNYDRPAQSLNAVMDEASSDNEQSTQTEKVVESGEIQESTTTQANQAVEGVSTKTFLQKLSLKDKPRPFKQFIFTLKQPFIFFTFPVVVYAGFAYGSSLVWFNVLNATASLILSSPPYNFKASMVGLSYLSPFLGSSLSTIWSGMLGDKIILALARRHNGRMEPEDRLWLFTLTALFCPVGLILWGVGAAHGIHWFGLIVATFILAASIFIAIPTSCNYAIDSYQQLGGQAMVTVIIVRNTMSFAINYGITPWITNTGLQNTFIAAAFISMAQSLVFLIFVKWGKQMRIASKDRYWKMVNESAALGVTH
ncbi:hypothetical protein G7Y89_g4506 [Cudoniella acicularis]|uniref:amidase n=1 Tax=Cudoniella acicularis TaxID=354080 RepID=A0A8H4W7E1_9HELO|nr:hypothetical protein G7Y89_g4506 [Cudoniella acicularis]